MGHYDSDYEAEADKARKQAKIRQKEDYLKKKNAIYESDMPDYSKQVAYAVLLAQSKGLL